MLQSSVLTLSKSDRSAPPSVTIAIASTAREANRLAAHVLRVDSCTDVSLVSGIEQLQGIRIRDKVVLAYDMSRHRELE